jgi:hypothetical protein
VAATADLTYERRAPRLRRTPAYAVPVAATGLVAAGVASAVLLPSLASPPPAARDTAAPEMSSGPATTGVPATAPELVVDTVSFAGTTYVARRDSGRGPLVARDVATLPAGAARVDTTADAEAWFGAEPATGEPALFVEPTRPGGGVFSLSGAGWTQEQLVAVLEGAEPRVVPHVD